MFDEKIKESIHVRSCPHSYHLDGIITGKVHFRVVRIKVKHMELSIVRRETSLSDGSTYTENDTVCKYEVMDGAPVRGSCTLKCSLICAPICYTYYFVFVTSRGGYSAKALLGWIRPHSYLRPSPRGL